VAIAFEGVSVIPMDTERVVGGQTVVVDGDRISWIGPEAEAQLPAGAQRVAGRGKYLMPGLADMHCHPYAQDDLLLLVTHGVTTIRNLQGMPRHVLWRRRIEAGELLGPTIFVSGPIVDGRPPRSNGNLSIVTREEAIAAVEHTKRGGYDCVKVYDQLSPEAYGWIVEAARERNLPVDGHIPFRVGLHGALAAGQRTIEHLYGYPQALQPESRRGAAPRDLGQLRSALFDMAQHAELERIPELAEATRAAGTWNCATLVVRTRWCADKAALAALPELRYLSPPEAAEAHYFFQHYPTEPGRFAVPEFNAAVLRGLHAAGCGILVGTDAGVPGMVYGPSAHEELRNFVDAGLPPFDTLRAATSAAAEFVGQAGEWGAVRIGARADLLLLDGNPLADITNTTRRSGVMVRGRWLPQSEIDQLLDDLAERRQAPVPAVPHTAVQSAPDDAPLRLGISWDGFDLGDEEIVTEGDPQGGRRIHATASQRTNTTDGGLYRSAVLIDGSGNDQSGWFEIDGDDGSDRVEMTRANGSIQVRHRRSTFDELEFSVADPDGRALFGRPMTPLYVRLADRLGALEIGGELDVPVIAPGIAPDLSVGQATMHAVRLPDADDSGRRYRVEFSRPNWNTSALLVCDSGNRFVRLDLSTDMAYWHNNSAEDASDDSVLRISRLPADR
jgi:imidazolonepropionase-like amidohydrolase